MAHLIERGLDPKVCRLFVVDGAKALSKAIRRTFGADTPIQRCQVHKARNITERLPQHLHAGVRRTLRQTWELDDAPKAERLLRHLARRLDPRAPGVSGSILEGLDEILTVTRLGLPPKLCRSLACTNIIESMNSTVRQVCRNVKRWRNARMALRWMGTAMLEAKKRFRRLKAHRQLPILKAALEAHRTKPGANTVIDSQTEVVPEDRTGCQGVFHRLRRDTRCQRDGDSRGNSRQRWRWKHCEGTRRSRRSRCGTRCIRTR